MSEQLFTKGTKVVVSDDAPFHKGRVGHVYMQGEGVSSGTLVLEQRLNDDRNSVRLFAISSSYAIIGK